MGAADGEKSAVQLQLQAVVSPLVAGARVPSWWEPLFRSSHNGSIFSSATWIQTWLDVYGDEFKGQWVHWQHDGRVVGGCLLVTRITWPWLMPMRSLFLNATGQSPRRTPLAEYNDILHLPGFDAQIATDAARIVREMRWSRFHMLGYQNGALVSRLIAQLPLAAVNDTVKKANFADLALITEVNYESTLSGKVGSHIRRNRRLYEKEYGVFEVVPARGLDEAMHYFDEMAALHNARWASKGEEGSFSSAEVMTFHRQLIGRLWAERSVDLICVRSSSKIIGYLYNFILEKKVYVFQTGFVYEEGSRLSPGLMTHALSIEHYRQKGFAECDFLAGEALYKRSLARHNRSLHWTVAYRDTWWTRFLLRMHALRNWARDFFSKEGDQT